MKAAKFTPGPWESKEVPTQCGRAFRIGAGAMLEPGPKGCCIIYDDYGVGANERKANAHLIASAPDMAEALEAAPIRSKYHGVNGFEEARFFEDYDAFMAKRHAALSKAEGR